MVLLADILLGTSQQPSVDLKDNFEVATSFLVHVTIVEKKTIGVGAIDLDAETLGVGLYAH